MTPLVSALQPSSMLRPRGTSGYAIRTVQPESISNPWATNGELLPQTPFEPRLVGLGKMRPTSGAYPGRTNLLQWFYLGQCSYHVQPVPIGA